MLEMKDVSKVFRTDLIETHALRNFSLKVKAGEFLAVTGPSGSGKTTLLRNIITQDLFRTSGPPRQPRRMPMLIVDGKADSEYLAELLPAIEAAGRMHQLRVLNPSRPDISVRYNPFFADEGLYQEHANFVFESFDLKQDFFHGHQATYLNDLVRVLTYTGKLQHL